MIRVCRACILPEVDAVDDISSFLERSLTAAGAAEIQPRAVGPPSSSLNSEALREQEPDKIRLNCHKSKPKHALKLCFSPGMIKELHRHKLGVNIA